MCLNSVVADATFHLLMSALNVGCSKNTSAMLETALTSHSLIAPYVVAVVAGSSIQSVAAV